MKIHNHNHFFKYVTAETAIKILDTLKVKCSSPTLFNDPFDSQFQIQNDVDNENDLMEKLIPVIINRVKPVFKNRNVKEDSKIVIDEILKDSNFVSDRFKGYEQFFINLNERILSFSEKDRVFCVSEKNEDLLMWAHYADEHKGAVIKFKCVPGKDSALCAAKQVVYSEKMPILSLKDICSGDENVQYKILNEILLTKSSDWEYEKEWRVIISCLNMNQDFDYRGIFKEELSSIYLGCRMSEEDKKRIFDVIKDKKRKIKIFDSKKDSREFRLVFNQVN